MHFINHFSGCQLCTQQNKNEDYKACEREFIKSYEYANSVMMKMLARRTPRSLTLHAQIAGLPFCQVLYGLAILAQYDVSRQLKVHASLLLLRQQDVGTSLHQNEHITMSHSSVLPDMHPHMASVSSSCTSSALLWHVWGVQSNICCLDGACTESHLSFLKLGLCLCPASVPLPLLQCLCLEETIVVPCMSLCAGATS